mmetsp:Transcript_13097/g.24104  ORF Transcript_13097/g.24104 Transcript_13097/m.24104 type:complete len:504 (+) Transcript_13097:118-1629(+)
MRQVCIWPFIFVTFPTLAAAGRISVQGLSSMSLSVDSDGNDTLEVLQIEGTDNECFIQHLNSVCYCEKKKWGTGRFQCTGCKNASKWGYGCELDCPAQCKMGCDFAGNCLRLPHCKHTKRVPGDKDIFVNSRGECQSCIHKGDDWRWGENCEHQCPVNCKVSDSEGACTRGGSCYSCKDGWFGDACDKPCPDACPRCVQKDHTVPAMVKDTYLPAGACLRLCLNAKWGTQCEHDCPNHCLRQGGVSCSTGICDFGCDSHQFYGASCENKCSPGCKKKQCRQADGVCMKDGCNEGYWGPKCDQKCPDHSVGGCRQADGLPKRCEKGFYPFSQKKNGQTVATCKHCSPNCKKKDCSAKGVCKGGCKEGAFDPKCSSFCPPSCAGPCDRRETGVADGVCQACKPGFTGARCDMECHGTCKACKQYTGSLIDRTFLSPEGDNDWDCTVCNADEPVELNTDTGRCDCIPGATRKGNSTRCECDPPEDPTKKAVFDKSSRQCVVLVKGR